MGEGLDQDGPRRVLAACRGAAAAPVLRWARQAGVECVVLAEAQDETARWTDGADYVAWLPELPEGELPAEAVVEAALDSGCDAVHPSWGPLSTRPAVAAATSLTGLLWVGPTAEQLSLARARHNLRASAQELGIPVVPASGVVAEPAHVSAWLAHVGRPTLLRPLDPRAPRVVLDGEGPVDPKSLEACFATGPVILERLVVSAREVEVPFLGTVDDVVVLGTRETTVADPGGRVFVECPAPGLSAATVEAVTEATRSLGLALDWRGLGTARFLLPPDGRPYLLQLKAGLLPWDAVTDEVHGLDLVDTQVRVARDEPLLWDEDDLAPRGHGLALVLRATEDGELGGLDWPEVARVDSGLGTGDLVAPGEILGVLTVRGPTRQAAIVKTRAALDDVVIEGIASNLGPLRALFDQPELWRGPVDRDRAAAVLGGRPAGQRHGSSRTT